MGRHSKPTQRVPIRGRLSPVAALAVVVPAAAFLAAGAKTAPAADSAAACCADSMARTAGLPVDAQSSYEFVPVLRASRASFRVVQPPPVKVVLPVGVAPESGLQVKTILAARAISAAFPEILDIGGVRPDSLRWHPNGLALDVMIPNYGSAEGIALGDEIVRYVLANSERFALENMIWRGTFYTPSGPRGSASGHYDHVHIATKGGGYPTGREVYLR